MPRQHSGRPLRRRDVPQGSSSGVKMNKLPQNRHTNSSRSHSKHPADARCVITPLDSDYRPKLLTPEAGRSTRYVSEREGYGAGLSAALCTLIHVQDFASAGGSIITVVGVQDTSPRGMQSHHVWPGPNRSRRVDITVCCCGCEGARIGGNILRGNMRRALVTSARLPGFVSVY